MIISTLNEIFLSVFLFIFYFCTFCLVFSAFQPLQSPQRNKPKYSANKLDKVRKYNPSHDYQYLNCAQLRQLCTKFGIKWRGVKQGKHLTKTEMITELINNVSQERLMMSQLLVI